MWRTCIHNDVITDFIEGKLDLQKSAHITTAKLSITSNLFNELSVRNGKNHFFQQWITSLTASNSFSIHHPNDCPSKIKKIINQDYDYFIASYFNGSQIIVRPQNTICKNISTKIGLQLIESNSLNPEEIHTKDQLKKIVLEINGSNDYDTIDNLFLPEDEITIYDKFINATSMELICHLTKKISSTSKITIFTGPKKRHTKSIHEITSELNACNPSIIVNCHIASDEFIKRHHDRYIFLGNRMQINFTGGLDSFGLKELSTGKRKNKYSFINIYETNNKPFLTITSKDGISNKVVRYVDK